MTPKEEFENDRSVLNDLLSDDSCTGATRYKAIRRPTCDCTVCWALYWKWCVRRHREHLSDKS